VTERTRRNLRLVAGLVIPHTLVVLVQRYRARHRAAAFLTRHAPPREGSRPFDYEAAVALLAGRGLDEDVVRLGSITDRSMRFLAEQVAAHAPAGPVRSLHVGNFVGVSLAALADTLATHHPDSLVVSVDPNLTHLGVDHPQDHVLALLTEFGLQHRTVVISGYTLEGSANKAAGEDTLGNLANLGARFGLALIDGNHDADYLRRELDVLVRMLDEGALLVLDDVSYAYPAVMDLFDELAEDDAWPLAEVARDDRLGVLRKR